MKEPTESTSPPYWHTNLTRVSEFFPVLQGENDGLTTVLEWASQQLPNEGDDYVMTADDASVANLWFQAQQGAALAHIALTTATSAHANSEALTQLNQIRESLEQQNQLLTNLTQALVTLLETVYGPPGEPEGVEAPAKTETKPVRRPAPKLVVDNVHSPTTEE